MYIKIYTYICTHGRMLLYYLIQKVGVVLCQQTWIDGLCTTPRSPLHTGAILPWQPDLLVKFCLETFQEQKT